MKFLALLVLASIAICYATAEETVTVAVPMMDTHDEMADGKIDSTKNDAKDAAGKIDTTHTGGGDHEATGGGGGGDHEAEGDDKLDKSKSGGHKSGKSGKSSSSSSEESGDKSKSETRSCVDNCRGEGKLSTQIGK